MNLTIKDVRVWPAWIPNKMKVGSVSATASISCVVVEVTTEEGVAGHGITSITDEEAVVAVLEGLVAPNIIGLDALDREKIAETLYWLLTPRGQTGYASHAISAIDLALWDILGKAVGLPCWRLLGGARRSVPLYVTFGFGAFDREQLVEAAHHLRSEGVSRFKMVVGHHALAKRNRGVDIDALLREDVVRVRLVREAIGEDSELYIDANCSLNEGAARWLIDSLRDIDIAFFEEPVRDNDPVRMRELRHRTGIRIAAGQNEGQLWRFASLIREEAADVLQPNAVICGGFTAAAKVAALAQANNVDLANGGAFPFHNGHLHAGLVNGGLVEWHLAAVEMCRTLFLGLPEKEGQTLCLSDRPGLGFDLNYDALEDFARRATAHGHGKG
ncbi:mandelate racemase/muconate lactonizing enzyme family protein [Pseudochelatococcus lubricantis]|uniref:mandelate racemase/muconate lactonizing enzyme family protein n=1 Tax=Pseudochelatococcus lubricantis TaxID=1538102 RepID=UPI0035E59EE7